MILVIFNLFSKMKRKQEKTRIIHEPDLVMRFRKNSNRIKNYGEAEEVLFGVELAILDCLDNLGIAKMNQLDWAVSTEKLTNGDLRKFHKALEEIHGYLEIPVTNVDKNNFYMFPTWNDVFNYFAEQTFLKEGCYDSYSLERVKSVVNW